MSERSAEADPRRRVVAALERGAGADELRTLGALVDVDLCADLLDRMGEIASTGDRAAASRYADRLAELAAGLQPPLAEVVVIEVELLRAAVAVDDGRFTDATRHAEGVLARVTEQDSPEVVARAEEALGVVAKEQARPAAAMAHWDRAQRIWCELAEWLPAATAAASSAAVARAAGCSHAELRERWAEAAELFDRAGVVDDARTSGVNASVYAYLLLRDTDPAEWDARRFRDAALDARAFALRFGADHEAAHLALLVAIATNDLGGSPTDTLHWTGIARTEYAALEHDPAELTSWQAIVDFAEGNAAITAGDPVRAEPMLRRAMAGFEQTGDANRARACRLQLLTIAYHGEPGGSRAADLIRGYDGPDADFAAVASLVDAQLAQQEGRDDDAERLHLQTRALLMAAGEPVKAVVLDLAYGSWRLGRGDPAAADRALAAADSCLAEPPAGAGPLVLKTLQTQRDMLRAGLMAGRGDRRSAIGQLAATEADLLARGARTLAARTAIVRGQLLVEVGKPAEGLAAALPATLALDAVRFTLADARRRHRWSAVVAAGFALVYRAAAAAGQLRVLAELLEVARAASMPAPLSGPTTGVEAVLAEAAHDLLHSGPAGPESPGTVSGALVPGAAALVDASRTAVGLPARLLTPWGTVALAEALDEARRYLDPIRADALVEWTLPSALEAEAGSARWPSATGMSSSGGWYAN